MPGSVCELTKLINKFLTNLATPLQIRLKDGSGVSVFGPAKIIEETQRWLPSVPIAGWRIKVKIWRKCYLSLTIKWKLVASKLYNQSFCSDLKATDTIPPSHTHTMLVWIPKLASSQSSIYHCFAQLFDFLCRDGGDWRAEHQLALLVLKLTTP